NLLRIQHERQRKTMFPSLGEYSTLFGLNKERLKRTKPDALIMHPGPINRGVEIDSEIADCERSLILEQVTNGLAVRMAVLFLVNGGKGPQELGVGGARSEADDRRLPLRLTSARQAQSDPQRQRDSAARGRKKTQAANPQF